MWRTDLWTQQEKERMEVGKVRKGWEGDSGLGTRVHPWRIHINVWQNQYSIVKQNKVKIKIKKINREKSKKTKSLFSEI